MSSQKSPNSFSFGIPLAFISPQIAWSLSMNIAIHSFTIDGILRRAVVLHNLFITGLSSATYGTFIGAFFFLLFNGGGTRHWLKYASLEVSISLVT